jgi:hypothetical protein
MPPARGPGSLCICVRLMIVQYHPSNHHRALITMKFRRRPASAGRPPLHNKIQVDPPPKGHTKPSCEPNQTTPCCRSPRPRWGACTCHEPPRNLPLLPMHVCSTSSSLSRHVHCESAREKRTKRPLIGLSGTMCVQRQAGGRVVEPRARMAAYRRHGAAQHRVSPRSSAKANARALEKTSPAWASGVSLRSESTVPTRPLAYVRFTASYRIDRLLLGVWRAKDPSSDHSAGAALCLYSTQTCACTYVPVIRRYTIRTTSYVLDRGRALGE